MGEAKWIGVDWIGVNWIGMHEPKWIGLEWIRVDWIGVYLIGMDWVGVDEVTCGSVLGVSVRFGSVCFLIVSLVWLFDALFCSAGCACCGKCKQQK